MFSLIVLLFLRVGEEQLLDDRCGDSAPSAPITCGVIPPKLFDSAEDEQAAEPRITSQVEQPPVNPPFMPRAIMAGMPQDYQQQIQPMRGFLAAVNWDTGIFTDKVIALDVPS